MTVYQAIRSLELAALGAASTTQQEITENGAKECRRYISWLRQQASYTSWSVPPWEALRRKPSRP